MSADASCTDVAHRLLELLARGDGAGMAKLYASDASFADPVFGKLHGADIGRRLRLLTEQAEPHFTLEVVGVAILDADTAHAKWRTFGKLGPNGAASHNEIISTMLVRDGLVVQQHDNFAFSRWAEQALGLTGQLLGRSQWLQRRTQRRARAALAAVATY